MVGALPRLKALWLNGNGVARALAADAQLQARLEILNRNLTTGYSEWALRYLAEDPEGEVSTCVCLLEWVFWDYSEEFDFTRHEKRKKTLHFSCLTCTFGEKTT